MKTILCAGGGSKIGFIAGVLNQLAKAGTPVDSLDGVSAGAISVASVAHAPDFLTGTETLIKMLDSINQNSDVYVPKDSNVFGLPLNMVADLTLGHGCGIFNNSPLWNKIKTEIPEVNPWCKVGVVRTSLRTGLPQRVVRDISGGITYSTLERAATEVTGWLGYLWAVLSSTSIEIVWDLVFGLWGDGGNTCVTPVQYALDDGATDIIIILTGPFEQGMPPLANPPGPAWDTLMRAAEFELQNLFWKDLQIALASDAALTVYAPLMDLGDPLSFNGAKIKSQIALGQAAVPVFTRPAKIAPPAV